MFQRLQILIKNIWYNQGFLPENLQKKGEVVSSIMDLVNFVPISNTILEKGYTYF